jgi:hypothetical protein
MRNFAVIYPCKILHSNPITQRNALMIKHRGKLGFANTVGKHLKRGQHGNYSVKNNADWTFTV